MGMDDIEYGQVLQWSEYLVVDSFVVDEVVEQLETMSRLVLGHHVSRSLHCYHRQIIIHLVKTTMLIFDIPWTPSSSFFPIKFVNIFFSIRVRDHIIKISTIKPYSNPLIYKNSAILIHRPSHSDRIVKMSTIGPSFVDFFSMERNFVQVPIWM